MAPNFETLQLHAGYDPHTASVPLRRDEMLTIVKAGGRPGHQLPRRPHLRHHRAFPSVPAHGAIATNRHQSYVFNDSEHGARLFGLKEFGNIYSRIMNVRSPSPFPSLLLNHPSHIPAHRRRLREAHRSPRRRRRRPRRFIGPGGAVHRHQHARARRRQHRLDVEPLRRHLQPVQGLHAAAGHRDEVRGRGQPRGHRGGH